MDANGPGDRRWRWTITTGELRRPDGSIAAYGHSGHGDAMNDPSRVREKGVGPLPPGLYRIGPAEDRPGRTGDISLHLVPLHGTEMFGRDAFYIHGPNRTPDLTDDSEGCPIAPRPARLELAVTPDRLLEVVEGDGPIAIALVEAEPVDSEIPIPPPPTPTAG